jgi:hypothetical protein
VLGDVDAGLVRIPFEITVHDGRHGGAPYSARAWTSRSQRTERTGSDRQLRPRRAERMLPARRIPGRTPHPSDDPVRIISRYVADTLDAFADLSGLHLRATLAKAFAARRAARPFFGRTILRRNTSEGRLKIRRTA